MKTNISIRRALGICIIAGAMGQPAAQAKSFVSEATRVVDGVTEQSQRANGAIEAFYKDFNEAASGMVDLEARMEQWRQQGDLCQAYAECPDKYDLIYAYYGDAMARIQQAFDEHRDQILAALSRFNQVIYRGKDRLSDLRSNDLAGLPAELSRLRREQEGLKTRKAELEQACPSPDTRGCARKWRNFKRSLNQTRRKLQRLAYARRLAQLRESMLARLDGVLDRYGHLETDTVATLADYAFLFEQYGEISGSQGIGQLLNTARELEQLDGRLRQMQAFGKGLELHVIDVGNLMNDRLDQIAGQEIELGSRSDMLENNARLLNGNDRLLRELEQEIGALQAELDKQ